MSFQIKDLLRHDALTTKDIAEALEKSEGTIKTTLIRMAKRGSIVKLPEHKWGLREYREVTSVT